MAQLDSKLWRQVSPYLDEALELEPQARAPWLDALEKSQPQLARELRGLLALHAANRVSGFLERSPLSDEASLIGQKMGAYTIERLLGRGGMGTVWLGQRSDNKFEGRAAIKLLERRGLGKHAATQIRHEANLLARLSHAHIARLFDAGVRENGQPYLILEYVEGEPIDQYCQSRHLSLTARLRLFLDVLDAVAHAQAQLIVHGDLKPSNVLVTHDGVAKLLDFGVAALRTEGFSYADAISPQGGPRALTPGFAAPEQLRGEPISAAADVYALGVLLHTLITGRHPFGSKDSTSTQLVRATLADDPPSASAQVTDAAERRRVRGDLDTIVARALNREPSRRYAMAADLATDIRHFLDNFPVQARHATRAYLAQKFVQRHWAAALIVLLTLFVLVGAIGITTVQMLDARRQRDFARTQLARAEALNELTGYVLEDVAPAEAYRDAGLYREALAAFGRVWMLLVAQGRDNTAIAGFLLNDWALTLSQLGRPLEAERLLRKSMEIHRADSSDAALPPLLMTNYAQQLLDLGRAKEAQSYAEQALRVAARAGDEALINETLLQLARIYRAQHDYVRSLSVLDQVEPRLHKALPPQHYAFASLDSERAQTLQQKGDIADALQLANSAIRIIDTTSAQGKSGAQYLPNMLRHRAAIETAAGQLTPAESDARRALALLLAAGRPGDFSLSTGQAYLTLARCLEAQGRAAEARDMAAHAAGQLEKSVGVDHPDTRAARELAGA